MNALQRFVENIGDACGATEYSAQRIIKKLENEVNELHGWLLNNEPGSDTWREKRKLMLDKMENLNEIKEENKISQL